MAVTPDVARKELFRRRERAVELAIEASVADAGMPGDLAQQAEAIFQYIWGARGDVVASSAPVPVKPRHGRK